ncbi:MAG: hypothetical protein QF486_00335 [Candidatus Woesearchaeota archaeon]|jgi:hypothetical protein|nr:hypothetical protein [Candidatus Woesearchaeota archaeon]MDP7181329.1 hypothetical protein [Candidatus Woesearchaeota archaeon]MDP7198052.1 hypothetical protein [Candidatus Woesearchaeota archaeon]MDP7466886.1 hypothetical protein [Candidatus Woesearchaeota archaeon]MDP7647322.1 hypothetical protein [Candidatus Woesearchaeota archaeon]
MKWYEKMLKIKKEQSDALLSKDLPVIERYCVAVHTALPSYRLIRVRGTWVNGYVFPCSPLTRTRDDLVRILDRLSKSN